MDLLYPFKAVYYLGVYIYITNFGTYDQKQTMERVYNDVEHRWEFGEEIGKDRNVYY